MKRTSKLSRRTPLARAPMKRRKRSAAEQREKFDREYGGAKRDFVASLPCLVPGCPHPSEAAHVVKIDGGMGLKGTHEGLAPLCHLHHSSDTPHALHRMGPRTFERLHRVSLEVAARRTEDAWQQRQSGLQPLSAIVPGVVRAIVEEGE